MARIPEPADVVLAQRPILPPLNGPGLLLIDKPKGKTSFAIVKRLRYLTGIKKVGHSGTLDPMATGLLILMLDRATRLMNNLLSLDKAYEGTIRLGERTASYDAETPVLETRDCSGITVEQLRSVALDFVGDIVQETPVFSAVKVGGERLYRKARRGETVTLPKRSVCVSSFRIESFDGRDAQFAVVCSSGTYVRALANDIGQTLGVGAHLTALRRTRIGSYSVQNAWTLDELEHRLAGSEPEPES